MSDSRSGKLEDNNGMTDVQQAIAQYYSQLKKQYDEEDRRESQALTESNNATNHSVGPIEECKTDHPPASSHADQHHEYPAYPETVQPELGHDDFNSTLAARRSHMIQVMRNASEKIRAKDRHVQRARQRLRLMAQNRRQQQLQLEQIQQQQQARPEKKDPDKEEIQMMVEKIVEEKKRSRDMVAALKKKLMEYELKKNREKRERGMPQKLYMEREEERLGDWMKRGRSRIVYHGCIGGLYVGESTEEDELILEHEFQAFVREVLNVVTRMEEEEEEEEEEEDRQIYGGGRHRLSNFPLFS